MSETNHLTREEQAILRGRCVVIAGHGELAVLVTRRLAAWGIGSFVLLSSTQGGSRDTQDLLIRAIQESGKGALIHVAQVARFDSGDYLYPGEIDLMVDCCALAQEHTGLENACRAQGVPIVLAFSDEKVILTGLIDPYAGSLSLIFGSENETRTVEDLIGQQARASKEQSCFDSQEPTALTPLECATGEVERHGLEALLGRASYFAATLDICNRAGGRSKSCPMPVCIPRYPRLVLIGADRRNLGKTSLCAALTREFVQRGRPVRALKIQNERQVETARVLEESPDRTKRGVRALFDSGCERIVRLTATRDQIRDALPAVLDDLYETMGQDGVLLCESSTARQFLQPGYFVHLTAGEMNIKTSALRSRRLADRTLTLPFTDEDVTRLAEQVDKIIRPGVNVNKRRGFSPNDLQ
ncbi:MAG TPA: hypothetical protein VFD19_00985 [Clostridia bacterium]|nr:hypothetical protein [Clostridia bacterium]